MNNINKRKNSLKIGIIVLVVVLALSAILVVFTHRTTFTTYASTTSRAAFEDIRTGTFGNPNASNFRCVLFQRNINSNGTPANNFTYRFHGRSELSGFSLANLIDEHPCDTRANTTLRHQSYAIRQRQHISSIPLLTLITHGQGGAGQRFY